MKTILPLAACLLIPLAPACVIDARSHVENSGRRFSRDTLDQIQPGRTQEFVLGLLGEPSARVYSGDKSEVWKWQYKTREHRSGSLIFVFDADKTTETDGTTYVLFEEAKVAKVWQD